MDCMAIWREACEAGTLAGRGVKPTPMVVYERQNPWDDRSPIKRVYEPVMDGVCGFAWVNVKPGYSAFAKWLVQMGLARKDSYEGGVTIWISQYNQSYERKQAHAAALAATLRSHDIRASAGSRLD